MKSEVHSYVQMDFVRRYEGPNAIEFCDSPIHILENEGYAIIGFQGFRLNAIQAVSDDISYIQSQNRGLQVQTQNQRALLAELENLLVGSLLPCSVL